MAAAFKNAGVFTARSLSDRKGEDISLIFAGASSPISDYFLLVTALSSPHLDSLEDETVKAMKVYGLHCLHRSRPRSQKWRVLDYGGVVIHLMTAEAREFYALEKLYPESPRVRWAKPAPPKAKTKAKVKVKVKAKVKTKAKTKARTPRKRPAIKRKNARSH